MISLLGPFESHGGASAEESPDFRASLALQ